MAYTMALKKIAMQILGYGSILLNGKKRGKTVEED